MIETVKQTTPPTISTYSGGVHTQTNSSDQVKGMVDLTKTQQKFDVTDQNSSVKKEDVPKLVDDLNELSESLNVDVKFAYNDKINEVYVNVTDKNTGKVIRKLPSEEAMKIKETMKDVVGSLFDVKG